MPIYEFFCTVDGVCDHLEIIQAHSAPPPLCRIHKVPMKRALSTKSSFRLKGSGWAKDGYSSSEGPKEGRSRAFNPLAIDRGHRSCRYLPIGEVGSKIVETKVVEELELGLQTVDPPAESRGLEAGPAVEGTPPEHALGGGAVRRQAGLAQELAMAVDRKEVSIRPHVGAVP